MKITIVTVVLNDKDNIEQTLLSVINQEKGNFEIEYIVIDGESTDGTSEIIEKYRDKIALYIREKDKGIYDAMNKAIMVAKGEIIAFMNSGDWYESNAIKLVSEVCADRTYDLFYGKVKYIVENRFERYIGINSRDFDINDIFYHNIFCHQGLFIRTQLFKTIGLFNLEHRIYADYDWNLKAINSGAKLKFIDDDIANFRAGGVSSCSMRKDPFQTIVFENLNGRVEYMDRILKSIRNAKIAYMLQAHPQALEELLQRYDEIYVWGTGKYSKKLSEWLKVCNIAVTSYIDSNGTEEEYLGRKIINPDIVDRNFMTANRLIIIATVKYENEIADEILSKNISRNSFISYRQIEEYLVLRYPDE